ncbi:MAG: ABC transporter substrate-binding protein [Burkholderiaceae bacterium]|jgi:ABC-type transport system substrate-binding protein|nr:ABC transporter substrate-binding protein [Burkholderiaceae bacterium]MDP4969455.1 ABC transporter substrate-binding protein [Burkholderiaceae bacterium]MDP5111499.1 ABC transporter substrate-binding protein [Burkholderiaceae bacterium]
MLLSRLNGMAVMVVLCATVLLAGCEPSAPAGRVSESSPINSPYAAGAEQKNILYTAFTQRSPKFLDPARSYSTDETPYTYNIYEPLYGYHYLKRPYELIPRTATHVTEPMFLDWQGNTLDAEARPSEIVESVYDITLRPGILYQPHPVFARLDDGRFRYWPLDAEGLKDKFAIPDFKYTGTRELTAHDYVYALRRLASPRVASPIYSTLAQHVVGMEAYGKRLREVDAELRKDMPAGTRDLPWLDLRSFGFSGIEALDEYTVRIRVKGLYPQFKYWLAMTFVAPIPWEADRFYSQPGMAQRNLSLNHWPVGTGPYMLTESLQNRRHVLSRNPNFRGEPYPCEGEPGDQAAGLLADCGKMTPFIDRIIFNIEKESIPLQGKFMQGYYDIPQVDRGDTGVAMLVAASDSTEKAALYAKHGIQLPTTVEAQMQYFGFNWRDPVVGQGDTPEQQVRNRKLRQALSIAFNWEEFVAIFQNDQAQVAYGPIPPGILGYVSGEAGFNRVVYDVKDGKPQRKSLDEARRLLAEAGYPNGRHEKTGAPLVLYFDSASGAGGSSPTLDWMRRQFANIGVQLDVRSTDYNRFQEKMARGVAQMYMWGWVADYPDAENFLFLLYGPNVKAGKGGENASNYVNPAYDALFERMRDLPDGDEKAQVIAEMIKILQVDAPWMFGAFPKSGGAFQQWVGNAKPTQMVRNTLQYMKIDPTLRAQKIAEWNPPIWWPLGALMALLAAILWPAWRVLRRQERLNAFGEPPQEQFPQELRQ